MKCLQARGVRRVAKMLGSRSARMACLRKAARTYAELIIRDRDAAPCGHAGRLVRARGAGLSN